MLEDARIYLCALWVALMLTYLLGDVLRIFSGDFTPGKISGVEVTQDSLSMVIRSAPLSRSEAKTSFFPSAVGPARACHERTSSRCKLPLLSTTPSGPPVSRTKLCHHA